MERELRKKLTRLARAAMLARESIAHYKSKSACRWLRILNTASRALRAQLNEVIAKRLAQEQEQQISVA
jgi:hypothetical protein